MNLKGKYIVIEGLDGAGTTTQLHEMGSYFKEISEPAITIAEPGDTVIGGLLRKIIKNSSIKRLPESNLDMFTISRRELAAQVIEPNIDNGIHVVSDRNWFSSVAYQGFGEGIDHQHIVERMKQALGRFFMPDLVVIVKVPVDVAIERMIERDETKQDYFESMGETYFEKVYQGYEWLSSEFNQNTVVVDGTKSIEEVRQDLISHLAGRLSIGATVHFA